MPDTKPIAQRLSELTAALHAHKDEMPLATLLSARNHQGPLLNYLPQMDDFKAHVTPQQAVRDVGPQFYSDTAFVEALKQNEGFATRIGNLLAVVSEVVPNELKPGFQLAFKKMAEEYAGLLTRENIAGPLDKKPAARLSEIDGIISQRGWMRSALSEATSLDELLKQSGVECKPAAAAISLIGSAQQSRLEK